ncbi:hypothetical protein [Emcibacter sp.]|uniref:hypothetical protein n=1 Tax=Emcibacter sp. TaxID=1979954 RepID=UPI002AA72133|nr:hypothetical protein [Emcibacter sp.]
MAENSSNVNGKAYAINVVTPIKPWTTLLQKLVFWYVGVRPSTAERLVKLSFIHFARWVIVSKHQFPHLGEGQPKEELEYDYLLFNSNFNGTWSQYIDAFSDVLPSGLNLIWNWSVKFPGSRPGTSFKKYIRHNQIDTEYYYVAYPGATINDVKSARLVSDAVTALAERADKCSPEEFERHYTSMLLKVQKNLGQTGAGPVPASD